MAGMLKYIPYVKEIIKGHVMHKNIPVLVTLCVTNRCNLRCTYCYAEYYDRDHKEFTTEEIMRLIDELSEMGTKYISINGGEALLRKDIDAIINKINEKSMLCHLSTNGLLVKKHIHSLKKVDSIAISIDGSKKTTDLNRGKGTYEKIIEAFECLKRNNIKFHVSTVLTSNNNVNEMMELAMKYNFKVQFSILRQEDSPDKGICLSDDEIRETIKNVLVFKKKGYPVFFSSTSYENVLDWPFSLKKQMISGELPSGYKHIGCYLKRFSCHIEANGEVYPCIVLVNKFKSLNFLRTGFEKAWENLNNCNCNACYNICLHDLNRIFGLKPDIMWNALKIVKDRIKRR